MMETIKTYWKQLLFVLMALFAAIAGMKATSAKQSKRAADLIAANAPDKAEATQAHEEAERLSEDDLANVKAHNKHKNGLTYD